MTGTKGTRIATKFSPSRFLGASLMAVSLVVPSTAFAQGDDLPDQPYTLTAENQVQYADIVLADKRLVVLGQDRNEDNYYYRRLTQLEKMPIKFTWDADAIKFLTAQPLSVVHVIENISEELVDDLNSTQGLYLKGPLKKVKELHLTTTTKKRSDTGSGPANFGYYPTFNKTTGVLTVAMSIPGGINNLDLSGLFGQWITVYVK